jgi:MFS family permease
MGRPAVSGGLVVAMLTLVNMVNFMDRGITPGAPKEFALFVNQTLDVPIRDTGAWVGALFSSFVACYSISSVAFAHILSVGAMRKFKLLSLGLGIWVVALLGSGLAYFMPRVRFAFWWFAACRALSGVGEATFQVIVPPYIEELAPPGKKSLWLGIFYTAIPTGTAFGFFYGSLLAPRPPESIGWGWAYLIEAILMAPCAAAMIHLPSAETLIARRDAQPAGVAPLLTEAMGAAVADPLPSPMPPDDRPTEPAVLEDGSSPTLLHQLRWLLCSPSYCLIVLGYAAMTASVMGISTFGPMFLRALALYDSELKASTSFGACAALGGSIGTPLGAYLTDMIARNALRNRHLPGTARGDDEIGPEQITEARAIVAAITAMTTVGSLAAVCGALVLYTGRQLGAFLALLTVAVAASYGTSSGISRAVMLTVPKWMRPFALAFLTLNLHVWGDVPSPPLVGALSSAWAPSCVGVVEKACLGKDPTDWDQPYTRDQKGILAVLLIAALYMLTSTAYWAAAYVILRVRARRAELRAFADEVGSRTSSVNGTMYSQHSTEPLYAQGAATAGWPSRDGGLPSHDGDARANSQQRVLASTRM